MMSHYNMTKSRPQFVDGIFLSDKIVPLFFYDGSLIKPMNNTS